MPETVVISEGDRKTIYSAYDRLKAQQGGLSSVSIGKLSEESGVTIQQLHQFLESEARAQRVDLHPSTLIWDQLRLEDQRGALRLSHREEPFISATIRERVLSPVAAREPVITREFVEQCLDLNLGVGAPEVIVEIAEGNPLAASLLKRIDRGELIDWLATEVDSLTEDRRYNNDVARLLLGYLRETQLPDSRGVEVKVESQGAPEQISLLRSEEYTQEYEATIWFEGIKLAEPYIYATGEYEGQTWVGKMVEWPEGLQGVFDLPEVKIDKPEEEPEIEDKAEERSVVETHERGLSDEIRRGTTSIADTQAVNKNVSGQTQSPESRGLSR